MSEFCAVNEAIQILQEKWVLLIVRSLLSGPLGFNELSRDVGGCNPATLAQRLERLEKIGVISKAVQSVMPPRSQYALTAAGHELQQVVDAIDRWATKNLLPPTDGTRARCGA